MNPPFLSRQWYIILFSLLGLVYIAGLFVPLMDNDSAHHANIALHMHLTGDYVSLVDHAGAYLDKPHLHFWLAAFSYKLFGVTGFAYKLPSFLFTILGTYSVFRLGKSLYNAETGKLAALLLASAFAFILANNDVRMDAILTAAVALASWQLVDFIRGKKLWNAAGAALGLALGFSTKGHIGVFVPAVGALFYILYLREWKFFLNGKWLFLLLCFVLFISPVVYCYYLQFNRHPELSVRGQNQINGVKFILLSQSIERFSGKMGSAAGHDYFFFIHSFLWAFAPWSLLCFVSVGRGLRYFLQRKLEWFTVSVFMVMLLIVTFSGFKLPHYLNIVFPVSAVITAAFIISVWQAQKESRYIYILQLICASVLLLLVAVVNAWVFPVKPAGLLAALVLLLALVFYFLKSSNYHRLQKAVCVPLATMILCFFLLNTNFYPRLLRYQGGNELARISKGTVDPEAVYFWKDIYSSSYNFYTGTLRKPLEDSVLATGRKIWLLYNAQSEEEIRKSGYTLSNAIAVPDFEVTRLNGKFLNPATREKTCSKLVLAEIGK